MHSSTYSTAFAKTVGAMPAPTLMADSAQLPVRARLLPHASYTPSTETVQFYSHDLVFGYVFLPPTAAYDVIHRLEETPEPLHALTAEVIGHVRHVLDSSYRNESDQPSQWTRDLINLIRTGHEEQRRQIGCGYRAYVCAVTIAVGPGGLEQLRLMHQTVTASSSHAIAAP
ncbi:hypothetical protein [Nonomuraea fuscirosea]|uniref:hypothetical protein n=1 Tax=Nonomuraea fuscirosea TaxID=1291556 RepID=UPI00340B6BCE